MSRRQEHSAEAGVDEALTLGGCDTITNVIVYKRTGGSAVMAEGRDLWWR
jgi:acetyl-CoA synthetase